MNETNTTLDIIGWTLSALNIVCLIIMFIKKDDIIDIIKQWRAKK